MVERTCLFALHMSAFGPKQTWACAVHMSAYDPKRTLAGASPEEV
jgi:Rieske Fe-S protein